MSYMGYFKNIIIILLVVLSIYQTNKVWDMGGASGLNFTSVNQPISDVETSKEIAMPTMIYRYNSYKDNYTGLFFNEYEKNYSVEYVYNILKKQGVKTENRYLKEKDLINCIMAFEYEIDMDYKTLLDVLYNESISNEDNFAFNVVYITHYSDKDYVNFVDKNTNMLNQFEVKKQVLPTAVMKEILVGTSYVNTMEEYNTKTNDFILDIENNAIKGFAKVATVNPYYNDNELLLSDVQNKVRSFFGNYSNTWSRIDRDSFVFSSDDIIIKYFSNNILEVSYYNGGGSEKTSLANSYGIARAFINNDLYITNEIFLQEYEVDDGKYTFYFDYYVDGLPVVVPMGSSVDSHIKVTIENNCVTNYKKLVYNYEKIEEASILTSFFDRTILEDYLKLDNVSPTSVRLVYIADKDDYDIDTSFETNEANILGLKWEIKDYNALEYIDTYKIE